jgi:thiosulfate/3-mercaptopyruvate sulfurtransferase
VDPGYGPRRGHITGAVNVPYLRLITAETAAFAAPDVLAEILGEAGLLEQQRVITYCGGAIAATVDAFVLKLFGHPQVSVYDGSLMEWSARDDLPMTNPSEAGS